jgi:hypothetical protein
MKVVAMYARDEAAATATIMQALGLTFKHVKTGAGNYWACTNDATGVELRIYEGSVGSRGQWGVFDV